MSVIVTGPEGSGTRFLTRALVARFGLRDWYDVHEHGADVVMHHPMPGMHAGFWDPTDESGVGPAPRFVIVIRRPDVTQLSLLERHFWAGEMHPPLRSSWADARDKWREAVRVLAAIPGAHWLAYEALVAAPAVQIDDIGAWLGLEPVGELPEVRDENAKWLTFLER